MFGLSTLRNAIARLATAFDGLASTMEQANVQLQERLALTGPQPEALEGPEEIESTATNGRTRRK